MKAKLIALVAVMLLTGLALGYDRWAGAQHPAAPPAVAAFEARALPATSVTTLDGKTLALADLPEPAILLHFWASWCAPCKVELPMLLRRVAESDGELALVAVSTDDDRAAMDAFLNQLPEGGRAHVYWVWDGDKSLSLKQFNTASVPETILIDRQRRMVDKVVGDPGWRTPVMDARLKGLVR